jgi:hypothetical protein
MANLAGILKELQQERSRLDQAIGALGKLVGRNHVGTAGTRLRRPRRTLSAAARRRIAKAQKTRWAKWKAKHVKKAA